MNQIKTTGAFTNDIARELDEIRRLAAESAVRTLQEFELGWVGGGDSIIVFPQPLP